MTTRQIWEIDDYNRIIDGATKVLLFTVDTSSDDDPLPIMRKIAAAPAMYEALVETMRVLRSLRGNKEEWYTLVTPELLTAWDKNKAALAQAEGTNR
jgi:hypothetical protein